MAGVGCHSAAGTICVKLYTDCGCSWRKERLSLVLNLRLWLASQPALVSYGGSGKLDTSHKPRIWTLLKELNTCLEKKKYLIEVCIAIYVPIFLFDVILYHWNIFESVFKWNDSKELRMIINLNPECFWDWVFPYSGRKLSFHCWYNNLGFSVVNYSRYRSLQRGRCRISSYRRMVKKYRIVTRSTGNTDYFQKQNFYQIAVKFVCKTCVHVSFFLFYFFLLSFFLEYHFFFCTKYFNQQESLKEFKLKRGLKAIVSIQAASWFPINSYTGGTLTKSLPNEVSIRFHIIIIYHAINKFSFHFHTSFVFSFLPFLSPTIFYFFSQDNFLQFIFSDKCIFNQYNLSFHLLVFKFLLHILFIKCLVSIVTVVILDFITIIYV